MADTTQALISRVSVPPRLLGDPAPSGADLDDIMAAAMSAPDHGALKPWRFIRFKAMRVRNWGTFLSMPMDRDPTDEAAIEKEQSGDAFADDHRRGGKIAIRWLPPVEQSVATGIAAYNMILAAQDKGYGGILLTGKTHRI